MGANPGVVRHICGGSPATSAAATSRRGGGPGHVRGVTAQYRPEAAAPGSYTLWAGWPAAPSASQEPSIQGGVCAAEAPGGSIAAAAANSTTRARSGLGRLGAGSSQLRQLAASSPAAAVGGASTAARAAVTKYCPATAYHARALCATTADAPCGLGHDSSRSFYYCREGARGHAERS